MHITMVIIYSKTLEKKKGVDDVTPRKSEVELYGLQAMSRGAALFSCGAVEAGRWRDLEPGSASLDSLWDAARESEPCPWSRGWAGPPVGAITGLIRNLSLNEGTAGLSPSAAPPSKRHCRSLSFSDGRPAWRPQGSRVWTAVEKRRCHSGGSGPRCAGGGPMSPPSGTPSMQRSSSFSLPARTNGPDPSRFLLPSSPCLAPRDPTGTPHSLFLSQEQIGLPEPEPELGWRVGPGGLARSRSQPCVLNDKKIGMKRRRPAEAKEQRPSLDLAKMTQKRNFHSLSCPGISGDHLAGRVRSPGAGGCHGDSGACGDDAGDSWSDSEPESDSAGSGDSPAYGDESAPPWQGLEDPEKDTGQLGGVLDIEQIEKN